MPAVSQTVAVEGLSQLQRAFKVADKTLHRELRESLKEAAEPVKTEAERLALSGIPRLGLPWSQMRIGVTTNSVYIAPRRRGTKGPRHRPNLAGLLLGRSMLPALDHNQAHVVAEIDRMLGTVGRKWENA